MYKVSKDVRTQRRAAATLLAHSKGPAPLMHNSPAACMPSHPHP
eukprot:CAMPEP_0174941716 /NCGR_PEP_ID=MMETSP1355-20121228/72491_1 /TAXON_ID=464990 /ORGANISM="Hemiselmis tepida, Strain CCMP443" /LENGTH=43 /DNA_ID= /DNA_START= /DNA_END= /DNA_ORIENTATION=